MKAGHYQDKGGMMEIEKLKKSKWIVFVLIKEGDKTDIWKVCTKDLSTQLGEIKWFSRWRTYSFFPYKDTVYEDDCLTDIANFIKEEMRKRKQ